MSRHSVDILRIAHNVCVRAATAPGDARRTGVPKIANVNVGDATAAQGGFSSTAFRSAGENGCCRAHSGRNPPVRII
jgi:hypothetical protein